MTTIAKATESEIIEFVEAYIGITRLIDMAGCIDKCVAWKEPRCAEVIIKFAKGRPRSFLVVSPDCFATMRGAAVYETKSQEVPVMPMQMTQEDIDRIRKEEGLLPLLSDRERQALRDQFAAAALAGMLEQDDVMSEMGQTEYKKRLCRMAYGWADAMLAARDEPTEVM